MTRLSSGAELSSIVESSSSRTRVRTGRDRRCILDNTSRNLSSFRGFPMTSVAPADMKRVTSSCIMLPVTPTIGPRYPNRRNEEVASSPFMTGISESIKMMEITDEQAKELE